MKKRGGGGRGSPLGRAPIMGCFEFPPPKGRGRGGSAGKGGIPSGGRPKPAASTQSNKQHNNPTTAADSSPPAKDFFSSLKPRTKTHLLRLGRVAVAKAKVPSRPSLRFDFFPPKKDDSRLTNVPPQIRVFHLKKASCQRRRVSACAPLLREAIIVGKERKRKALSPRVSFLYA